ncbi:MAG: hypothetical protein QME52_13310 [Bacteroidota bacterium]|nr:hypothetical protein [Bacteroidota bacterium]
MVLLLITILFNILSGPKSQLINLIKVLEIGVKEDFIRVEEITTDSAMNIYVTDAYQYVIKKYSSQGIIKSTYGKRGKENGEFQAFPFKIIYSKGTLGIVEKGLAQIQFLSSEFKAMGRILTPGPIVDICFDKHGRIYVNLIPYSRKKEDILILMDKSGKVISKVQLKEAKGEPAFDMVHLGVNKSNDLVVAFRFINSISIYNERLDIIKTFQIAGLPDQAPAKNSYIE